MLVCLATIAALSASGPRASALSVSRRAATFTRASELSMVGVGTKLPDLLLFEGQPEFAKATEYSLAELTKGKTVVIFAVPGAFTPGCSKSHLPSFIAGFDALTAAGVELVICTATNDPYVMEAWGREAGVKPGTILMLSDKSAALCRALGVASEADPMVRSDRYALIAKDGVVTAWLPAAMPDGEKKSENTYCPAVLAAL